MKFYVKQRALSLYDRFNIYDKNGVKCYCVEGEEFKSGKKFRIYSPDGEEFAYIEQRHPIIVPRYAISVKGYSIAEVISEFAFFRSSYAVTGLDWHVDGRSFSHEYTIRSERKAIASVKKSSFAKYDTYEIDISYGIDQVPVLAVALVIDACMEAERYKKI